MGFIRDLFVKANEFLEQFMAPIMDKIITFLSSEEYLIFGLIVFFLFLLLLIGLIRWLRKTPKLFFVILIICAAVVALWIVSNQEIVHIGYLM